MWVSPGTPNQMALDGLSHVPRVRVAKNVVIKPDLCLTLSSTLTVVTSLVSRTFHEILIFTKNLSVV